MVFISILMLKIFYFYVMLVEPILTGIFIFKHRIMEFAKQTGLSVIVCHYPPYCSKWNPIEHRLFSQVHRAMEGVVFSDYQTVQKIIEQTSTTTGLTVVVRLNLKNYQKGIKIDKTELFEKRIDHHPLIPELQLQNLSVVL